MRDTFCLPLPELFKRYDSLEYIKNRICHSGEACPVLDTGARIHTPFPPPLDSSLRWNDEWRI